MSKTQVFIEKARAVHGDRYDYSKTVYVRSKDKVIITCKEHGDFEQRAGGHLAGKGCVKCSGQHQYSTVEWIIEAKKTHGDRYDYSKVVYAGNKNKVIIGCRKHGDFEQRADRHLGARGCTKCSGKHRHSTTEWIIEAEKTHGDRYDYSKVVYARANDGVTITCKEHGDFEQRPSDHLAGQGCSKCGGRHQHSTAEWIIEAKKTHGDRYDYSKTVYVRSKDKVIITCKEHGDFEQVAHNHLTGKGCAKCSGRHQHSTAEWIIEAEKTHGDRYDYSKTVYIRADDRVTITCKEHGDFEQVAGNHLTGNGCPRCFWDRDQPTAIYLMQMGAQVKIGISIDPDARLAQLNRNNPEPAHIVATWTLEDFPAAYAMEQQLHQRLRDYHAGLTGFDGATEWFNTTPCHAEWVINKAVQYANEVCKL